MLLLNSIVGLILSSYDIFNWIVNDIVILFNTCFFVYLAVSNIKDGFKFGISFLFVFIAIIQFILGRLMKNISIKSLKRKYFLKT